MIKPPDYIAKTRIAEEFHLEDKRQFTPCLNSYHNSEIVRFNSELSRENARK